MKTRTIYKSTGYWTQAEWDEALDYYRDEWKEQSEDPCDDTVLMELIYEADRLQFDDERIRLNKVLDGEILVIADLGRWNGRFQGYKVIGRNLQDILSAIGDDEAHFYSDGKNIRADGYNHDGHSYYLFRVVKAGVDISALLDDIYNGEEISPRRLGYYTKSLAPYVASVYGW